MKLFIERASRRPRMWSNQILRRICKEFTGEIINVSGWRDQDKEGNYYKSYFPKASAYYISNFTGSSGLDDSEDITDFELDLEAPLIENLMDRFDVVFNHTTLEHVFDVGQAFKNLCSMSRDIVIIVVPFAQKMHFSDSYGDYWRFTPMTLRRLFANNGLSIVFETANRNVNSGIYLLSVGSRHPERWKTRLPTYNEINSLGEWIGWNPMRKAYNGYMRLKGLVGRL